MRGWGIFLIIVGSFFALGALVFFAQAALQVEEAMQPRAPYAFRQQRVSQPVEPQNIIVSIAVAGLFIGTGVGVLRSRPWVRPVLMVISAFVMAYMLLTVIMSALELPHSLDVVQTLSEPQYWRTHGHAPPTQMTVVVVFCITTALQLAAGIVLPWFMYSYFASPATLEALHSVNPATSWIERAPVAVIGWCALCITGGLGALLHVQHPAIAAFTTYVTGMNAIIALCIIGVLLLWGAWLCYRLDRLGWVLTSLIVLISHVSIIGFYYNGGRPSDLQLASLLGTTPDRRVSAPRFTSVRQVEDPQWLPLTSVSLEAALVLGFGAYVSMYFIDAKWRVGALRDQSGDRVWPASPVTQLRNLGQPAPHR